jgi:adenylate kinase
MRKIFVISGTPGVGKTTVSKLLSLKLNANLICLGEIIEKEKIFKNIDLKRETRIVNVKKLSTIVKNLILEIKGDIIIEGHFAQYVVSPEEVTSVFVLRRDPMDLKEILSKRGYRKSKIKENLFSEILDVCLVDSINQFGDEKVCELDLTRRKEKEVTEEIIKMIKKNKKCRIGIVDWLGKLEREKQIEYLRNL